MKYKPSEKQLRFLDWEFGVFFHFGIRSFNHGHNDWDGKEMLPESFNPDALDCEQWIREAKAVGAKYAILVTKHHDGFANWPSKYTKYSVAATPWKDGKGDVVAEYVAACRKYDMGVGLYYSPAQWGNSAVSFDKPEEYDDYFINQISELLSNYGKIDYLWFDGCGSGDHQYDMKRVISVIRSLQPDIMIFSMWDPDTEWVGNEEGFAPLPNFYTRTVKVLGEDKTMFLPLECDCRLRESWFYDLNEYSTKSVDELIGMYEMSVGRGANLLLNIGPDDHGRLCESDVRRLKEFRNELDRRFGTPLPFGELVEDKPDLWTVTYPEETYALFGNRFRTPLTKRIVIEEDLTEGQSVKRFRVYANIPSPIPVWNSRIPVYEGQTIGHKCIIEIPNIPTPKLYLEILDHDGDYKIKSLKAYGG